MTPITTLTAYLTGIATCTSVEEIKTAGAMENKVIYCGECEKFLPQIPMATASAARPKRFVTAATSAT